MTVFIILAAVYPTSAGQQAAVMAMLLKPS
jgi:hypothetical protein